MADNETRTLILVRHAKSDWKVDAADRERPLAPRGRRQAPDTGIWIAQHAPTVEIAVVSPAARARQTWELVGGQLPAQVSARIAEAAYTFDGDDLVDVVRGLASTVRCALIVGHNPAMEELVSWLTGESVQMPTSALAVIELPSWSAGRGAGRLVAAGRPSDGGELSR